MEVVDLQPKERHRLLMSREPGKSQRFPELKTKLLCGHDERHWFVASIPDTRGVRNVITAKEALKPEIVKTLERGLKGSFTNRQTRKNSIYLRQGEWFFLPARNAMVLPSSILRNEPLRRGRGKPHTCEFLSRSGGTLVYVNRYFPNGLTEVERTKLIQQNSAWARQVWWTMVRDPIVHVRGRISHADHATLVLSDWHRVVMNTENQARGNAFVAFLD